MPLPVRTQAKLAITLLRRGLSLPSIIARLGGGFTADEVTAGIAAFRIARNAARPKRTGWQMLESMRSVTVVPAHVLAERDRRRSLHPASITAALMHDPLPGCSAGERAPSIAPSIHRDPLDALMFARRKMGMRYG